MDLFRNGVQLPTFGYSLNLSLNLYNEAYFNFIHNSISIKMTVVQISVLRNRHIITISTRLDLHRDLEIAEQKTRVRTQKQEKLPLNLTLNGVEQQAKPYYQVQNARLF